MDYNYSRKKNNNRGNRGNYKQGFWMIVIDTNILVYATFKDSRFFDQSIKIIEREDVIIPQIVFYEYIKVLTEVYPDWLKFHKD